MMKSKSKSYAELMTMHTFEERFEYLKLNGTVGQETFGAKRQLNQILYKTDRWKKLRDEIIIRDDGKDLGIEDRLIGGRIIIHHINPITVDDVLNERPIVFDKNNLISVSHMTHEAIHYGDADLLMKDPVIRTENDTCPWKR